MQQATRPRSPAEAEANAAFDALLWALSRPGQIRRLPQPGEAPIIRALLDRECRAFSADPLLLPQILRSGAELAPIDAADHVFLGADAAPQDLARVQTGSDLYPDSGATVILRAALGSGPVHRLTGPGVDGALDLHIGGLPDGLWQCRADLMRYPQGFDLFILDGAAVVGIPRSTQVEGT